MTVASQNRTPSQHAAYKKLLELSRRNGKDIGDHHLQSHAIDVAISLETYPVGPDAIVDRVRAVFGDELPIDSDRVVDDLEYTSGTGKYSDRRGKKTWIVLDEAHRVVKIKEPRYPRVTGEILAFIENTATRMKLAQNVTLTRQHFSKPPATKEVDSLHISDSEIIDAIIEDAALGGIQSFNRLSKAGRKLSQRELELALQRANETGKQGEEILNRYFSSQQKSGQIRSYDWVSRIDNAIAPFDFHITLLKGTLKVEVKATKGEFQEAMHISYNQLREMQTSEVPYHLYRVYDLANDRARLRVAEAECVTKFADGILKTLAALPKGVTVDKFSVLPSNLEFGKEIVIDLAPSEAAWD